MRKTLLCFALLLCLGGMIIVRDSHASFYKYINKDGVACFADDLQAVPEQYRASAVIVETETDDDRATPAAPAGPAANKAETPVSVSEARPESGRPLSTRLMISGAVGLGAFFIFVVISSQLKEDKKALSIVRGLLMAGVSMYLVAAHVGDVMTMFGLAGKAVEEVERRSEERGKKAAQTIKSIDAMFDEAQKAQKAQESQSDEPAEPEKK